MHSLHRQLRRFAPLLLSVQQRFPIFASLSEQSSCADTVSNLAQALRSYSEAISGLGDGDQKPATFLEEAMWALSFCLKLQKESYHHQQTSVKDVQMGGTNTTQTAETRSEEAIWARIVEPITPDTILDTLVAQLETLTMLSKEVLASDQKSVHLIVDRYKDMIKTNLATFTPLSENRSLEINLAVANYKCAIADLRYNAKQIELVDYENTVKSAYEFDIDHNPQALCDAGESYVNFHTAVAHLGLICEPYLTQRWDALSRAEKLFTAGYKIPNADHKEKILIIKGDVELLRFQLGQGGANQVHAVKYAQTLLANASKFYKVAKQIANEAGQKEETFEAEIKGDIVDAYKGKPTALKFTWEVSEEAKKLVKNAVADGIVTSEQLSGWGIQEY